MQAAGGSARGRASAPMRRTWHIGAHARSTFAQPHKDPYTPIDPRVAVSKYTRSRNLAPVPTHPRSVLYAGPVVSAQKVRSSKSAHAHWPRGCRQALGSPPSACAERCMRLGATAAADRPMTRLRRATSGASGCRWACASTQRFTGRVDAPKAGRAPCLLHVLVLCLRAMASCVGLTLYKRCCGVRNTLVTRTPTAAPLAKGWVPGSVKTGSAPMMTTPTPSSCLPAHKRQAAHASA